MAEEANAEQLDEQVEIEAKPKKGLSGKKLVLLVILPLLLLGLTLAACDACQQISAPL